MQDCIDIDKTYAIAQRLREKYPHRVPVIVDPGKHFQMEKKKFLPHGDLTMGSFIIQLRKYVALDSQSSMLVFANNTLVPVSFSVFDVYNQHKFDDDMLYLSLTKENVFG